MRTHPLVPAAALAALTGAAVLLAASTRPAPAAPVPGDGSGPVGLSLFFRNGETAPIILVGDRPRYLQEIDVVATTPPSPVDEGIEPLVWESEFASLDWTGVRLVEEEWRPSGDGTFQRQRFYRGARWMEEPGQFLLHPVDAVGRPLGAPLVAHAGKDDQALPSDDGFIRRFVVRQIAADCPAIGDATGASFTVQGLAQFRGATHAAEDARLIPPAAAALRLEWTAQPGVSRSAPVTHAPADAFPFGYGFQVTLDEVSSPANGQYYGRGEAVTFRLTFRDGNGARLHPEGSLPTYGEFLRGEAASGLRYFDNFRINPTLFYALKHREGNLTVALSGPTDRLRTPKTVVPLTEFFGPQATSATVAVDGFSAVAAAVPPALVLLGGVLDPAVWETPVSDTVTLTIPHDAEPGTWTAAVKARRDWGGEALNRAAVTDIQVEAPAPTLFVPKTGGCGGCHSGPAALGSILHGVGGNDRRACFGCHSALEIEPDAALDIRVHWVHDRSARFRAAGGDMRNCGGCHLTPPGGPARGLLDP